MIEDIKLPIGTIISMDVDLSGVPVIIDGSYQLCNGSTVTDKGSPIYGSTMPNLNNEVFIRGGDEGIDGGTATHLHGVNQGSGWNPFCSGSGMASNFTNVDPNVTESESSLPAYYDVVYYMKIK